MLKSFVTVTEEENREIEKWAQQNFNQPQNIPVDILLLLLYKIHLLEKKINAIEDQTKTHWAK